jgi:hypothetical protein
LGVAAALDECGSSCVDQSESTNRFYRILAIVLSLSAIGLLLLIWGGFTPPNFSKPFHTDELSYNWSGTALALTYLGALVVVGRVMGALTFSLRHLALGASISVLVIGPVSPTVGPAHGQWGSVFWTLAPLVAVGRFNLLFWVLSSFSLAYLAAWVSRVARHGVSFFESFYAALIVGIILLFSLQPYAWERYIDPMLGIALSLLAASEAESKEGAREIMTKRQASPPQAAQAIPRVSR